MGSGPAGSSGDFLERLAASAAEARTAVSVPEGVFGYADLLDTSASVARRLQSRSAAAAENRVKRRADLSGARVCFLVPPGWEYVCTLWGVWRAGGLAVPMAVSHPEPELAYVLDDAEPEVVVAHRSLADRIRGAAAARGLELLEPRELIGDTAPAGAAGALAHHHPGAASAAEDALPGLAPDRPALLLYTSGTTGRPKGVVISHVNIEAQLRSLTTAWGWSSADRILLHLPLHHVHGIVNVLLSALWNGAVCEILQRFDPVDVWRRLAERRTTLYMAVPTVYRRLIQAWEAADPRTRRTWSAGARACRLMVSGSAALPVPTLERWQEITGHRLLERYGMTEIGMALTNPLDGERRPGRVGAPLPGVELRLVDDSGAPVEPGEPGTIQVRGPGVFREYWRQPEATAEAFTDDGWFHTGDQAVLDDDAYRILGRSSVDILKTGGEKISALEIEDVLRGAEGVVDCAVVGVPDPDWGDRVCAAVVASGAVSGGEAGAGTLPEALRDFLKARLAPYKVPKEILVVDDLPRNAMGKVTKPAVREMFERRDAP